MNSLENSAERFLILIQHPEKDRFIVTDQVRVSGLIGSLLLDLSSKKNISIEDKKLKVKHNDFDLTAVHKEVWEQISNLRKDKNIRYWLSKLSRNCKYYQKTLLESLEKRRIIEIIPKKFLFFNYYRTRLVNKRVQEELINELRGIIFNNTEPEGNAAAILGLIHACNLYRVVCYDRQERKLCKVKVKEILKSDSISQGVDAAIQEIQAAIIAAVVASSVAASSSSSS